MNPPPGEPLDALLVHAGWARTLARHLVRDADAADDLVQRAWVAALERPPAPAIPPRRWLAAVMRNLAREMRRGDARRVQRENDAARPERTESGTPLEQIELQRRLLAAIESLGEPYRAAVWARYYEGLSPRAIAARDGVPVKTVRTRLHRALNELRARLDREHGGQRGAWTALFLPLIDVPLAPAALTGAFLVDAKLKIACALAVTVGVLSAGFVLFDGGAVDPQPAQAASLEPAELLRPAEPIADAPEPTDRTLAAEQPSTPASGAAPAVTTASPTTIPGRVLDLEGRPVPNVRVVNANLMVTRAPAPISIGDLRSDAEGRFELPATASGATVRADDPALVTVFAGYVYGGAYEVAVHVAPRRELAGVVVDPRGKAVGGARVELSPDAALRRREGRRLDGAYDMPCDATTDDQGRFELPDAPLCAASIRASALGHSTAQVEAPAVPTRDLRLVLPDLETRHALVRGIVVDEQRRPVEGAWVSVGSKTQRTSADGRFGFDLDEPSNDVQMKRDAGGKWAPAFGVGTLTAVKAGSLPAVIALPPSAELFARDEAGGFELVLKDTPKSIEGHVVDDDGHPIAGVIVRTLDEEPFGPILEKFGEASIGREPTIEDLLRGGLDVRPARSGADGSFRIEGLLDREYRLVALDPATLRRVITAHVHAEFHDARVVLPSDRELPHVAGRIVSQSGAPLPHITV